MRRNKNIKKMMMRMDPRIGGASVSFVTGTGEAGESQRNESSSHTVNTQRDSEKAAGDDDDDSK